MVTTDTTNPNTARISGFDDDVSHVLAVTGKVGNLYGYLVPIGVVERMFRENQAKWVAEKPADRGNTTWTLRGLEKRFAGYEYELEPRSITPDEARRGLAVHFGTSPDKINISLNV